MIETSRTMNHWAHGVSAAINEVLDSGLRSESRAGDTLSVWTFNDDFDKNLCPQMELPLDPRAGFGAQVVKAVQSQASDKKASLDKIVTEINALAQQTDFLTVIVVSAGDADIHGTPFDARINQSFRKWQDEQKKARMPFVTALRIGHGKFMQCSITPAQWPLELPPFPRELQFVPAKPARGQVQPPGKGQKSGGPQYAELPPPPQSSNTSAAATSNGETKVTPAAIAKPAQEAVSKPTPLSPPAPVIARKEIQKPAPMDPRPAEAVPTDWKPFGNTLSDWLASAKPAVATRGHSGAHQAPQSESAPAPAKTTTPPTLAMQNSSGAPSAIVKPALESGSPRLALADWQPLEDAMKNWHVGEKLPEPTATRIENTTKLAPTIIAVEVKPVQISEIAPTSLTEARIAEPALEPVQAGPVTAETRVESTVSADGPAAKTAPVIAMRDEPVRPVESVFRKNAVAFAAILAAGTAAIFCFFNWFRTIARPDPEQPVALSLTPEDDLQPDRPQLDAAAIESAALKALLDSVPATPTATRRQAATTARLPEASTSRNASSKLAMHGQAA